MIKVSIIIPINSDFDNCKSITLDCIRSIEKTTKVKLQIILVDNGNTFYEELSSYDIVHFSTSFNYNYALNLGIDHARISRFNPDFYIFTNNDCVFENNWDKIFEKMSSYYLDTACFYNLYYDHGFAPNTGIHYNNIFRSHFVGWCIVLTKDIVRRLGRLNEEYPFWCADQALRDQLLKLGFRHALISSLVVNHVESQSHKYIDPEEYNKLTHLSLIRYNDDKTDN